MTRLKESKKRIDNEQRVKKEIEQKLRDRGVKNFHPSGSNNNREYESKKIGLVVKG